MQAGPKLGRDNDWIRDGWQQRPAQSAYFYDNLMPAIGASRIMEFGDNFTMYGTGMGNPGLAVVKPYDGSAAACGNGHMAAIALR